MVVAGRRKSIAFFISLGVLLIAVSTLLYVGRVLLDWRTGILLFLGVLLLATVIGGVVLNTIFLVREIRRNEQHDAFINAVTHELKTPVASLKLYLQTLQNHHVDEAKRQEFYQTMLEDSDRLLVTIEQVLRAGQIGARVRHQHRAPVDLHALVQECLTLARTRYRLPPEALTYRDSPVRGEHARVLGDEDELRTVISNLVDNAVKYSGPEVRVSVELEQTSDTTVALRVRDKGIGISAAERKRIFKRFYRVSGATRVKGAGLGLFIVRSLVSQHGGKIVVESDGVGHGSAFIVELPVMAAP